MVRPSVEHVRKSLFGEVKTPYPRNVLQPKAANKFLLSTSQDEELSFSAKHRNWISDRSHECSFRIRLQNTQPTVDMKHFHENLFKWFRVLFTQLTFHFSSAIRSEAFYLSNVTTSMLLGIVWFSCVCKQSSLRFSVELLWQKFMFRFWFKA